MATPVPVLIESGSQGSSAVGSGLGAGINPFSPDKLDIQVGPLINKGIAWVVVIAFVLSLGFMLWGGLAFILSGGKEDKIKKALGTIRYAIIGLVVTLLATTVISLVGRLFGIDALVNIIDPSQIFAEIDHIISSIGS